MSGNREDLVVPLRLCGFARGIIGKKYFQVIFVFFTLLLLPAAVFFCRKPVVLVGDRAFDAIYGEKRAEYSRFALSLRFFRPIKTIAMVPGAGPDLVCQGAISLSRRPFAVFFPYRYREAAGRYLQARPGAAVAVLAGRELPDEGAGYDSGEPGLPLWFFTDTETDLRRAGAFAGVFARFCLQNPVLNEDGIVQTTQKVAVFYDKLSETEKAAFKAGLENQGYTPQPLFLADPPEEQIACAVLIDSFQAVSDWSAESLIIFSWLDPAMAPGRALAIFDDSPWAVLGPALIMINKEKPLNLVPSTIIVKRGDKTRKALYYEINKLKTL